MTSLAELWEQYTTAFADTASKETVRNIHLRKADGGDELIFLPLDGNPLDGVDGWRQIERSASDVAYQVEAVEDVERCRTLLAAALHPYEEHIPVGLLMPEAVQAIGKHLTSAGHTPTVLVPVWESYGPVQYDTKGD